jgi:hypothetical protein
MFKRYLTTLTIAWLTVLAWALLWFVGAEEQREREKEAENVLMRKD